MPADPEACPADTQGVREARPITFGPQYEPPSGTFGASFVGGIAHDLNNLLTVIVSAAFAGRDAPDVWAESLGSIEAAALHAVDLVKLLMLGPQMEPVAEMEAINLSELVRSLQPILDRLGRGACVMTLLLEEAAPPIVAHRSELGRVVVNFVLNAIEATPEGGSVVVQTGIGAPPVPCDLAPDDERLVWIAVRDTGSGFTEVALSHLFEPRFSTKASSGSGLGLATANGIVTRYGGKVLVHSAPGCGSTVVALFRAPARTADH